MSNELPNRTVISNIWNAGPDDVVTYRSRFSKPGRCPPRLSGEVSAHRIGPEPIVRDRMHVGAGLCLTSAAIVVATIWSLGRLCGSW